jgi:uncharacterized protein YbbC (DUF1343 family)
MHNSLFRSVWSLVILIQMSFFCSTHANASVKPGDEQVLVAPNFSLIQGKKVGILAHYASRTSDGTSVVDLLVAQKDVQVKMIFSPEHGFRTMDDSPVEDSVDPVTGLPIYSLYGPRTAPTADMLAQIDVVLIDLQDVGLRYYTYPATVVYTLKAAKAAHKPVVILDRPNPIGGERVEGAVLDANLSDEGITTIAQIPTRYGMTLGETTLFLNSDLGIHADVKVVRMAGWDRSMHWDDTGLKWWPSSPALMQTDQIFLYATFGTLESFALSVGRGVSNDLAFRNYGAPWITADQGKRIVSLLSKSPDTAGLLFSYVEWTPDRADYKGELCRGFHIDITDQSQINSFRALVETSKVMLRVLGSDDLNFPNSLPMYGAKWLVDAIEQYKSTDAIASDEFDGKQSFLQRRESYLLY